MEIKNTVTGFAALSHESRLQIIRMLVFAGANGLAAGAIATALNDAQPSRVSFHLKELEHAGLVQSQRDGKSIIYSVNFPALCDLAIVLVQDCCQGHCKYCDTAIALLAKCRGKPTGPIRCDDLSTGETI